MSKPLHDVTEGIAAACPEITSTQQSRPKTASVSASCSRQTVPLEGSGDDAPTTGKRISAYPMQRRGSRKKTLSLNPEEREALENLIEEVIMGGVGEGVIDSDASSSDEDEGAEDPDAVSPSSENSRSGSSTTPNVGDLANTFVKGGKKFYPGQLKVAVKHMHGLPPRFVRKLAKAQQYLDAGGSMYSKPVVSVGRIEEEEETSAHSKDDSKQSKSPAAAAAPVSNVPERDRDKMRLKEHKLKDAKKVIRTLLTDRDQYVDETVNSAVVSSQSHSGSNDSGYSTTGDQKSQTVSQHGASTQPVVSACVNTVSTTAGSGLSIVTCASSTQVHHPNVGSNAPNKVAEYVPKTSEINYRASQKSNFSPSGSWPVPAQPHQPPPVGIPQYQLSMPVVHGMKPAQVLSQSPPGAQFWIPQAMVANNAPGYYGSSPPVVGMTGIPSAFNQPVPYAYSLQSSYPTAQGVHASYTPQYLYSASPPNQGMVCPPYSGPTYSQQVSYPLTVLPPEHYVGQPRAMSANFYQNTPPPGYCPTQTRPASDHRHMFAGDVSVPTDGMRKHKISTDYAHNLSAFSVPVLSSHSSPTQPVKCSIDARCVQSAKVTSNIKPSVRRTSPDSTNALHSQPQRFSKSQVNVTLPNSEASDSIPSSSLASVMQGPVVCTPDTPLVDKAAPTVNVEHSDTDADTKLLTSPPTLSSPVSSTYVLSDSLSSESKSGDHSYTRDSETEVRLAGSDEEILEPCSAAQKSNTQNIAQSGLPCTLTKSLTHPVNDLNISGMAKVQSVIEHSGGADIISSDTNDVIHHTVDSSGESTTLAKNSKVGSPEYRPTSDLRLALNSVSVTETSNRSSNDESQFQELTPVPASYSNSPPPVADVDADISLHCDGTDPSSGLVVTLSSSLVSSLVEMFGSSSDTDNVRESSQQSGHVCLSRSAACAIYISWLQSLQSSSHSTSHSTTDNV